MKYILLNVALLLSIGVSYGQVDTIPELDRIIFRNRVQLQGKIIDVNKKWVVIKVDSETRSINKARIASIYLDGEVISLLYGNNDQLTKLSSDANAEVKVDSTGKEISPYDPDRIIFKNHSQIKGDIIEVGKSWVVIKVGKVPFSIHKNKIASLYVDGEVISFLSIDRKRIKEIEDAREYAIPGYRLVPIKETAIRGFYNVSYGTFQFRNTGEFPNLELGFGISNTFGYQFNQYTGLGIGIGYYDTEFFGRGNIVPVYGEYRGYFSDKKVSAYYSIASGMSFGTRNSESLTVSSSPGAYFYPAIGFKSGSDESSFMVDVGVRLAKVTYVSQSRGFVPIELTETLLSRGFVLRIGVLL